MESNQSSVVPNVFIIQSMHRTKDLSEISVSDPMPSPDVVYKMSKDKWSDLQIHLNLYLPEFSMKTWFLDKVQTEKTETKGKKCVCFRK